MIRRGCGHLGGMIDAILQNRLMNWGRLTEIPFDAAVWGTVNGWVGTVVTSGSFLLAALVYRKNREDKRREQASLIAFSGHYTSIMNEDMFLASVRGRVHNHSSSLVTNAAIVVTMTNRTARKRLSWTDRCFRPHKAIIAQHALGEEGDITDTILPSEDRRYYVEIPYEAEARAEDVVVMLTFMDANSVEWERPYKGAPVEPKLPGKIRASIITRLAWKDWEKENPEIEENSDQPEDPEVAPHS